MNTVTIWILASLGGFVALILIIGLIAITIQFCIKKFRRRVWSDITSPPVTPESLEGSRWSWSWPRSLKRSGTDREPIVNPRNDVTIDIPDHHVSIPVNETDGAIDPFGEETRPNPTLVQIQRERLDRMREEGRRIRPMLTIDETEDQVQRAIDQVQKEFDESF